MYEILIGLGIGAACGSLAFLANGPKTPEMEAVPEVRGLDYYETLRGAWRGLRIANERDYSKRVALMNLSTAIWKMGQGEDVAPEVLDFLLPQLNGGGEVLAKIKGAGAYSTK